MAITKLGPLTVHTISDLPATGSVAPDFTMVNHEIKEVSLHDFQGQNVILNIFPSIDTRVCAMSVREFNKRAASLPGTTVLCISKDLPFALKRFCGAEGIDKVIVLSDFRNKEFGAHYGVELIDGGFLGLHARAIVVVGADGIIKHTELVPVIGQEPDYDAAIAAVGGQIP
jgi:thioredoxin-dependent peroxiredoxin